MLLKEKTIIAAIFLSAGFFIFPKLASAQVVINEIMYDLKIVADDKHEWVEIYNNSSDSIDLTGWKFNDGDTATNHALNPPSDAEHGSRGSIILSAGGYLLLADNAGILIADLPNYQGTIIDTIVKLSNTSATLKLLNSEGQEMALAFYSKEMGAAGSGKTLEWDGATFKESLSDGGTPGLPNSVLNQNPVSPTPSPSPSPTPSPAPSPAASAGETISPTPTPLPAPSFQYSQDIFLNEFLPYPEKDEKEWAELYNTGSQTINLTGWQIDDEENSTTPLVITDDTQIKPGEFLIVTMTKSTFNNDGDQVRLLWPDGQVVHSVAYPSAKQNQSCSRFDNQWLWTGSPTPGQTNKKSPSNSITTANVYSPPPQILTKEEIAANVQPISQNSPKNSPAANNNSGGSETNKENPEIFAAGLPPGQNSPNPPAQSNQSLKIILILFSIVALAALAGTGLVFFRRWKIDKPKTID